MYIAIRFSGNRVKEWKGFDTEAEIDAYAKTESGYDAETIAEEPDFFINSDPPIIFAVIADSIDSLDANKIAAPYAVYVRGQKWICSLPEGVNPVALWSAK